MPWISDFRQESAFKFQTSICAYLLDDPEMSDCAWWCGRWVENSHRNSHFSGTQCEDFEFPPLRARYCVPTVDIPGREGGSRESFDPNLASHWQLGLFSHPPTFDSTFPFQVCFRQFFLETYLLSPITRLENKFLVCTYLNFLFFPGCACD